MLNKFSDMYMLIAGAIATMTGLIVAGSLLSPNTWKGLKIPGYVYLWITSPSGPLVRLPLLKCNKNGHTLKEPLAKIDKQTLIVLLDKLGLLD